MDATQVIDDDFDEEELNNSGSKKTVAFLKVLAFGDFPETIFPVYEGENIIGRHDSCDITIPLQAVSKKHACIDVHGHNHLICDYNSRNKTRRNQMFMKPQAFYELVNEIELMFADVKCQYLFVQAEDVAQKDDDSGSETASESMIPPSVEDDELEQDLNEEKQEELGEKYLEEATQDYSYKNPVLCEDTDEETDDESKEVETGSAANETVGSSLGTEQTVQCSPQGAQMDPTIDATIPCNTLLNTLEPDIVPETPYPQTDDFEPPFKLKRSVDVKADTSRRISAGNTLAYGLSTLESPNSTRESMDASESEKTKEEAFTEGFTPEPKNKLHFEDAAGQETPDNNKNSDKKSQDSFPREDEFLDDLLATQLYEPMEIPESPEFLQKDASDDELDREGEKVENESQKPKRETSGYKTSEGETFEGEKPEGEIPVDENNQGNSLESPKSQGQTVEVKIPGDDMMETQAYGLGSLSPEDEYEEMATQAYGLTCDRNTEDELAATQAYGLACDANSADTEDEPPATQAYGTEDTIVVPKLSDVFKVPGAMNTQELDEDFFGNVDENEKVAKEEYDDEMDIQPTQKYFDNQVKEGGERSESSDNLPSFSNIMGLKSDSDSDFMSTRKSSKKKADTHIQSSTPIDVKKSSVVIEGQNAISTEKRCYVECPGDEASQDKALDVQSSNTRKRPARGRKKSTAQREKEEEPVIEGKKGLRNIPGKDDLAVSSTKGNDVIVEDADNQQETIVVKRGKGRSTRGRKSTATTRSSRGKKDDVVVGGTDGDMQEDKVVESLPKGRKNTRKRKISEKYAETKVENSGENTQTEQKEMNVLDSEDNRDLFKLQISAIDPPDTDDFIPRKESVKEPKRTRQQGKKVLKEDEERNDKSKNANIVGEKLSQPSEAVSVSTKPTRKGRGKKNKMENDGAVNEQEMDENDKDGQRTSQSARNGRARKSQVARDVGNSENITEDVRNGGIKDKDKNNANQRKIDKSDKDKNTESEDIVLKLIESEKPDLPDAMTPVVPTRISKTGKKAKQTATKALRNDPNHQVEQLQNENKTSETKIEELKTQGRARKRKSSENSSQNETQQKKGTAKKSRKNTTTEEMKTEIDEGQASLEATASSHGDKFESEELELTPKSLSRRSSSKASTPSSSSSKVSRSGRKGKKQEVKDSEGSVYQSSNVKVIFTGLSDALLVKGKKIVQSLGGEAVEHVEECTHLVTDKVRRTVKFLCALSRGVPIVDVSWLDASKKSKSFIDSTKFILQDEDAQRKYNFNMERSLELAKRSGLLDGYKIHVTARVRPPPGDMKEIIKCAKGEIVSKMPTSCENDVVVMSCDEDKEMCKKAHLQTVYTAELLLTGILRQQLDLEQYKLTLDATPDVNSTPAKNKGRRKR